MFEPGEPKVEIDNLVSHGPLVVAETRAMGRMKNGKDYRNLYTFWFEVRDAKVFAIREYMDSHYIMKLVS
jgi:uncharacterized protein